jgi:hypothetical protein
MPQQGMTLRTCFKFTFASQYRLHATVAAATVLCQTRRRSTDLRIGKRGGLSGKVIAAASKLYQWSGRYRHETSSYRWRRY